MISAIRSIELPVNYFTKHKSSVNIREYKHDKCTGNNQTAFTNVRESLTMLFHAYDCTCIMSQYLYPESEEERHDLSATRFIFN